MRIKEQRYLLQRVNALDKDCLKLLEFMEDVIRRYYGTEEDMLQSKQQIIDYYIRPLEHDRLTEDEEKHLRKLEQRYNDFSREYYIHYDKYVLYIRKMNILPRELYG